MPTIDGFICKPCQSRAAFEFIPNQGKKLELEPIKDSLSGQGIQIEAFTPFVLVFKLNGVAISLFKNGKLLVKEKQKDLAAETAKTALKLIK